MEITERVQELARAFARADKAAARAVAKVRADLVSAIQKNPETRSSLRKVFVAAYLAARGEASAAAKTAARVAWHRLLKMAGLTSPAKKADTGAKAPARGAESAEQALIVRLAAARAWTSLAEYAALRGSGAPHERAVRELGLD